MFPINHALETCVCGIKSQIRHYSSIPVLPLYRGFRVRVRVRLGIGLNATPGQKKEQH